MYAISKLFEYTNDNFCGTSVYCPIQTAKVGKESKIKSIKGIKFPQIEKTGGYKTGLVKNWTALEERSGVAEKEVNTPKCSSKLHCLI